MVSYNTICVVVAAGSSQRMKSDIPKQYIKLSGESVLSHTLSKLYNHPKIDAIIVVYSKDHQKLYEEVTSDFQLLPAVEGGKTRQESVKNGLDAIKQFNPRKVLIHDAARPFITENLISELVGALDNYKAAIPCVKIVDTVKKAIDNKVTTIDRDGLYKAQTPQAFIYSDLLDAYSKVSDDFTDDSQILESLGLDVKIIESSDDNFKITYTNDLIKSERLMNLNKVICTGIGYDVHKFCPPKKTSNNTIRICGVDVDCDESLEGHSDADVGIHAIVDALLGAIGKGDIGEHFPPSDDSYKDMDSVIFLNQTKNLIDEMKGQIINIDVTIICQKPKISPYKEKMVNLLSKQLLIEKKFINVKATTTEGLGFTGRKEGVAAQAVANIYREL